MKALTVLQPYAELIAQGGGVKPIENRTWATNYRGLLIIHAGKSREMCEDKDLYSMPNMAFGAAVAVARLVTCLQKPAWPVMSWDREKWGRWGHLVEHEHALGPWCWVLEDVRRFSQPIEIKGAQGLWNPPAWLEAKATSLLEARP